MRKEAVATDNTDHDLNANLDTSSTPMLFLSILGQHKNSNSQSRTYVLLTARRDRELLLTWTLRMNGDPNSSMTRIDAKTTKPRPR